MVYFDITDVAWLMFLFECKLHYVPMVNSSTFHYKHQKYKYYCITSPFYIRYLSSMSDDLFLNAYWTLIIYDTGLFTLSHVT